MLLKIYQLMNSCIISWTLLWDSGESYQFPQVYSDLFQITFLVMNMNQEGSRNPCDPKVEVELNKVGTIIYFNHEEQQFFQIFLIETLLTLLSSSSLLLVAGWKSSYSFLFLYLFIGGWFEQVPRQEEHGGAQGTFSEYFIPFITYY